jgi:hypothetical protein
VIVTVQYRSKFSTVQSSRKCPRACIFPTMAWQHFARKPAAETIVVSCARCAAMSPERASCVDGVRPAQQLSRRARATRPSRRSGDWLTDPAPADTLSPTSCRSLTSWIHHFSSILPVPSNRCVRCSSAAPTFDASKSSVL